MSLHIGGVSMSLLQTIEYDKFKFYNENRKPKEANIVRVQNSILEKNLLEHRPVIVDAEFYIIDGQHRVEACKRLGLPVPYIIHTEGSSDDVILYQNQTAWRLDDYLHYHAARGIPEYIKLREFIKKNNETLRFQLRTFLTIINGRGHPKFNELFKKGLFVFPTGEDFKVLADRIEEVKLIIDTINDCNSEKPKYLDRYNFQTSLFELVSTKNFKLELFVDRLQKKCHLIKNFSATQEYVNCYKIIYDFRNKSKLITES